MWPFGRPRRPVNGLVGCVGGGHDKENGKHARERNLVEETSSTGEAAADPRELMRQQVNAQLNDGVTSPNGPAGTAHPPRHGFRRI